MVMHWILLPVCLILPIHLAVADARNVSDWTPHPVLRKEVKGRGVLRILSPNLSVDHWSVHPAALGHDPAATVLTPRETQEGVTIQVEDGRGNYHWIAAYARQPGREFVLATAHHFPLAGPSPTAMLAMTKSRLEIIPTPLPREHSTYRAGEAWKFLLRFDQHPLPDRLVTLHTLGHTAQEIRTDRQGVATVILPPFVMRSEDSVGRQERRPRRLLQPFQLAVEHQDDGERFVTVFQQEYGPDGLHDRQPLLGWLVAGLGMMGGLRLWRFDQGGAS
ncbi:MAG: DUF4198 domain-containing protein [Magnetococcus sp. YQC-9]